MTAADIDTTETNRIAITASHYQRDDVKSIPGAKWSTRDAVWKAPLAWTTCLALRATFGEDLEVGPALATWATDEYARRIAPALDLRERLTLDGHEHGRVVDTAIGAADEMGLFKHQAAGAAFMAVTGSCLIGDETGTGKSAQAIGALRTLHRLGEDVFPVLVVAPNSVKRTWAREWATWWPGIQTQLVEGSAIARRKALETPAHVYIVSWDVLPKHSRLARYGNMALKRCVECGGLDARVSPAVCEVHPRELNQLNFKTIIADEAHRAKSPQAKWTRALWAIGDGEAVTRRYALTGTPVQANIGDLWSLLHFISPAEYSSKTAFVDRFVEVTYNLWGALEMKGVKESAKTEFYSGFDTRFRRMTKKAVLPFLPPILRETRYVDMHPAQAKAYKQVKKEMIAELESGDTLVVKNTLSKSTRLIQFASAYAELHTHELEDGRVEVTAKMKDPSPKLDTFVEDLLAGDFGTETGTIVFSESRQLLELLKPRLEKKDIDFAEIVGGQEPEVRQANIDRFQSGAVKLILVTVSAGGVGLTLTAADTMVFLTRPWSSIGNTQAEARAHRIGSEQHESIKIVDYVSNDTIEEYLAVRLAGKYESIEAIVRDEEMLLKILKDEK